MMSASRAAERVEVSDHRGRREGFGERFGRGACLLDVTGAGGEPRLEDCYLGGEIVVSAPEVGEAFCRVTGLPRTDAAFPLGGDDPRGAVFVDPAELAGIAGRAPRACADGSGR